MINTISPIIQLSEASEYSGCILGYGHFNSIHTGHIRYLKRAKELNNILLVAILKNPKFEGLIFSQNERADSLAQLGIANAIVLLPDNNLEKAIETIIDNAVMLQIVINLLRIEIVNAVIPDNPCC